MKERADLTRMCASCGEQKPLAMFLQITGAQGTLYGSICATCRAKKSKTLVVEQSDDEGSSATGLQINAKAKIQSDIERKKHHENEKVLNEAEAQADENSEAKKLERAETKVNAEKFHRQRFLEGKRSFLGHTTPSAPAQDTTNVKAAQQEKNQAAEKNQTLENQKIEEERDQEFKQTTTDFSSGVSIDPQQGIRYQHGDAFKNLKNYLGTGAHFRATEQRAGKATDKKKTQSRDPVEFIEKNWGPTSGRKR